MTVVRTERFRYHAQSRVCTSPVSERAVLLLCKSAEWSCGDSVSWADGCSLDGTPQRNPGAQPIVDPQAEATSPR